jgi:hypothetical protein
MYINKAQLLSMSAQLTEQLGVAKVAGNLSKSTEVMKIVNDLMRTPQLVQTMQQMSKEMMKVHPTPQVPHQWSAACKEFTCATLIGAGLECMVPGNLMHCE